MFLSQRLLSQQRPVTLQWLEMKSQLGVLSHPTSTAKLPASPRLQPDTALPSVTGHWCICALPEPSSPKRDDGCEPSSSIKVGADDDLMTTMKMMQLSRCCCYQQELLICPSSPRYFRVGWGFVVVTYVCSSWPHRLWPARLLCPCKFPDKNTGVGCHFLLQGIFQDQRSNPHPEGFFTTEPPGKPREKMLPIKLRHLLSCFCVGWALVLSVLVTISCLFPSALDTVQLSLTLHFYHDNLYSLLFSISP